MSVRRIGPQRLAEELRQPHWVLMVAFIDSVCMDCLRLLPALHALESRFGGVVEWRIIDVRENPSLARRMRAEEHPAIVLYSGGRERARAGASTTEAALEEALMDVLMRPE